MKLERAQVPENITHKVMAYNANIFPRSVAVPVSRPN
jgi:hypothetical protein